MVNWDFVVLFGTIMFWALLHVWSPDGKQWRTDRAQRRQSAPDAPAALAHADEAYPNGDAADGVEVAPAAQTRQG
jgi:hypothetical protein